MAHLLVHENARSRSCPLAAAAFQHRNDDFRGLSDHGRKPRHLDKLAELGPHLDLGEIGLVLLFAGGVIAKARVAGVLARFDALLSRRIAERIRGDHVLRKVDFFSAALAGPRCQLSSIL